MKDFYMGAVVEVEELALGENPPQDTPPQGVIITRQENDGWIRRYLYRSYSDLSGKRVHSQVLYSEARPKADLGRSGSTPIPAAAPEAPKADLGRSGSTPIPFQSLETRALAAQPIMDTRLNFPPGSQVKLAGSGRPVIGQAAPQDLAQPPAPAAPAPAAAPLPFSKAPAPAVPPPPGLPAVCDRSIQLPDGTILNPDDALTFKDFCALLPYIEKAEKPAAPGRRPGGGIPVNQGFGAVPSFGPAGSPFGQGGSPFGGGGGGGGGQPAGPGPIGVVNNPAIGGAGGPAQAGPPGPIGPTGPAGAGSVINGKQITSGFTNAGAMAVVPGSTFTIVVGGDGTCEFEFSAILAASIFASVWDVSVGIQIDSTQYLLWEDSAIQGAGGDRRFTMTAAATLFTTLAPGSYTISLIYGYSPAGNAFSISATPSQPASISCKHS